MSSILVPGRHPLHTLLREPRLLTPGAQPLAPLRVAPYWAPGMEAAWIGSRRLENIARQGGVTAGPSAVMRPTDRGLAQCNGSTFTAATTHAVSLGSHSFLNASIVALIRSTATGTGGQVVANVNYNGSNVPIVLCIGGQPAYNGIAFYSSTWRASGITTDVRGDNQWHTVGGTLIDGASGTALGFYIDGNLDRSTGIDAAHNTTTSANPLTIGAYLNDGVGLSGDIAAVFLWKGRTLSAAEMAAIHADLYSLVEPADQSPLIFDLGAGGGGAEVLPSATDTALATLAPVIATGAAIAVPVTDIAFTGLAPSLASGVIVDAPATDVAITAYAPTVETGVAVAAGVTDIALEWHAPSIQTGVNVSIDATDIAFAAYAPSLASGIAVNVPITDVTLATHVPTIGTGVNVSMPAVDFLLAAFDPIVVTDNAVTPSVVDITFASHAPTIGAGVNVAVPATDMTVATHAPSLGVSVAIDVPVTAFAIDTLAPTIATGASVSVTASNFAIAAFAPSFPMGTSIAVPLTDIAFSAFAPRLGSAFVAGYPVLSVTADRQPSTVYANRRPKTIQ